LGKRPFDYAQGDSQKREKHFHSVKIKNPGRIAEVF
jgi:hypothetical protein